MIIKVSKNKRPSENKIGPARGGGATPQPIERRKKNLPFFFFFSLAVCKAIKEDKSIAIVIHREKASELYIEKEEEEMDTQLHKRNRLYTLCSCAHVDSWVWR